MSQRRTKAAGKLRADDADVDRVVRTLTLYLDMHDAKFTGPQTLGAIDALHELYASKERFQSFFVQKSLDENEPIPRRGLREILRFGQLPPLRAIFVAHQVEDQTVQEVEGAENGPLAAAQRERERLHKQWVLQPQKLDADELRGYVGALAEVRAAPRKPKQPPDPPRQVWPCGPKRHGPRQLSDERPGHGARRPAAGLVLRRPAADFLAAVDTQPTSPAKIPNQSSDHRKKVSLLSMPDIGGHFSLFLNFTL